MTSHNKHIYLTLLTGISLGLMAHANPTSRTRIATFPPNAVYKAGTSANSIALDDFDHDGINDLVVVDAEDNSFHFFRGFSDGSFAPPSTFSCARSGAAPSGSIVVLDANRDGNLDLAIEHPTTTTSGFGNAITVHLGDGTGNFGTPGLLVLTGGTDTGLASADFNRDRNMDLAVGSCDEGAVLVHLGAGDGSFGSPMSLPVSTCGGGSAFPVIATDLNNDGFVDLVAANEGSDATVSVFLGDGSGGFESRRIYALGGSGPVAMATGDFNRDGAIDLAVANYATNSVSVLAGDGHGALLLKSSHDVGLQPRAVAIGYLTGDELLDVVVANRGSNSISVLTGNGLGAFSASSDYAVGLQPIALASRDLNGDGTGDIVISNAGSHNVTALLASFVIPGTDFKPLTTYPMASSANGVVVADFNRDNKQDIVAVDDVENSFRFFAGLGDGAFSDGVTFDCSAAGAQPRGTIVAADFNNDGMLDLAIEHPTTTQEGFGNTITIHLGNGAGSFGTPGIVVLTGGTDTGLATADFNRDGKQDLAVGSCDAGAILIHFGNGDGTFTSGTTVPFNFCGGGSQFPVVTEDLNGDGIPDLIASNLGDNNTVSVFLGNGGGGFGTRMQFRIVGSYPIAISSGDFNRDGRKDIAVANYDDGSVSILLGDGTGALHLAGAYAVGGQPRAIISDSLSRGAIPDIAVINSESSSLSILQGDGTGAFPSRIDQAVGVYPLGLASARFNRDGLADLVVTNGVSADIAVLRRKLR